MRLQTRAHRKVPTADGAFVYLPDSASIVRLDSEAVEVLDRFQCRDGLDAGEYLASRNDSHDVAAEVLEELCDVGAIRPIGEMRPPSSTLPPMPFPLATLVLNVSSRCNLSCTYCYEYGEDRLAGQGESQRPAAMSPETALKSIDFLFENARGRSDVSVTFFGGETLLNRGAIEAAVKHAEDLARSAGKRVHFALTTNATLLDDAIISYLIEHRFGVNISIDGDRTSHDRHRSFKSGRGSYDTIVPKIRRLLEAARGRSRPIGARVTLTRPLPDLRVLYAHLTDDIGFDEVGFAPVTSAPSRDHALLDEDYDALLAQYSRLADDYVHAALEGRRHGFSNLGDLLRELHEGVNKAHPCGAGLGLVGVATDGELGLCHRFVESDAHPIGDIEGGIDEQRRREFLEKGHVSRKTECATCFARPVCAGGCYHEAEVRYGDASHPNLHYCDWIRAWTDLGLRAYARIMDGHPEFFQRFERTNS